MFIELVKYGPPLIGLLLALCVWFIRSRSHVSLPRPARVSTAIGLVVVLALMIPFRAWTVWPWWTPQVDETGLHVLRLLAFGAPLLLSVIAMLFLLPTGQTITPRGSAELAPRTLLTFAPRGVLLSAAAVVVLIVVVSVSAGLASSPDQDGRYLMFTVDASANSGGATNIYGWWFSIPCLIAITALIGLALTELLAISRPPLAVDRLSDSRIRTTRVRNILTVMIGGLLLHLGEVLLDLRGTSGLRLSFSSEPAGVISLGTSFAAIGPALLAASYVAITLGFAAWFAVLLSTVSAPVRRLSESVQR